jgi:hypothetical protein
MAWWERESEWESERERVCVREKERERVWEGATNVLDGDFDTLPAVPEELSGVWHEESTIHLEDVLAVEILPVVDGLDVVGVHKVPGILPRSAEIMRYCPCYLREDEKKRKREGERRKKPSTRQGEKEAE